MASIRFYACYRIGPKQIAQVLVEMEPGKFSQRRETQTGVIYPTNKAAEADIARLNSQFAKS